MWEFDRVELGGVVKSGRETWYFLDWMEREVLGRADVQGEVDEVFRRISSVYPEVRAFLQTPQSAPWHCEGISLDAHVKRMLATVFALVDGADLLQVEEFSRDKSLHSGFVALQEMLREHAGFFLAYAFLHDVGKPSRVVIEAARGSKGEREGFLTSRHSGVADADHIQHYFKLFRLFSVEHSDKSIVEQMGLFFDTYELSVHYDGHDRVGAGDQFRVLREALAQEFHVALDDIDLLRLLTKRHMETIGFFQEGVQPKKFDFIVARAQKDGYDADDYLDFTLGAMFLDVAAGCISYEHGQFMAQHEPIVAFLQSELVARRSRQVRRDARIAEDRNKRRRAILEKAGLTGDSLFHLLRVPFGPGRTQVKDRVEAYVEGMGDLRGFEFAAEELERRVLFARDLLKKEHGQ